jgi:hypothetical protein
VREFGRDELEDQPGGDDPAEEEAGGGIEVGGAEEGKERLDARREARRNAPFGRVVAPEWKCTAEGAGEGQAGQE